MKKLSIEFFCFDKLCDLIMGLIMLTKFCNNDAGVELVHKCEGPIVEADGGGNVYGGNEGA